MIVLLDISPRIASASGATWTADPQLLLAAASIIGVAVFLVLTRRR